MAARPAPKTPARGDRGRWLPGDRDDVMLNARVPTSTVESLTAAAERRGISRSEAVRQALTQWLDTEAVPA